jgi:PAS domain S-box-containing protein
MADHKHLFKKYIINISSLTSKKQTNVDLWKDHLFVLFLKYVIPGSLIALIPGVLVAIKVHLYDIAILDLTCFALLIFAKFSRINQITRKLLVLGVFYVLAIFLTNKFGFHGPGLLYLLFITVVSALFLPMIFAYGLILLNCLVVIALSLIISFHLIQSPLTSQYNQAAWLTFGTNLIFISLVVVLMIHVIFNGLETTIIERDAKEEEIKRSELKLRTIFESTIDGIVLIDSNFIIQTFNAKSAQLLQHNNRFLNCRSGINILEFTEDYRKVELMAAFQKLKTGEVVEYDRCFRENSDEAIWIRYTITPAYEDSMFIGACITMRDVTASKKYLDRIQTQNKMLHDISWAQSHLVRAPLTRIIALTDMLGEVHDADEQEELLNYLKTSSLELDNVVRTISNLGTD